MIKKQYKKLSGSIEKHRFKLLLSATILVLMLAASTNTGVLGEVLFISSMSFLLIQSIIVSVTKKTKRVGLWYFTLVVLIIIIWLEPAGLSTPVTDGIKLIVLSMFFLFVTINLVNFIRKADRINVNVIITATNIYLLIGIIAGSLAFFFYVIYPESYNLPNYIADPTFVHFIYYSFVTMSTLGYGDITPALPQTQTLAYLIAVTGQLYVAIVIAILVGKLLIHSQERQRKRDA